MKRLINFFKRLFGKAETLIAPHVQEWLDLITEDRVWEAIRYADTFINATDAQRKRAARRLLQAMVVNYTGLTLPDSIANLLIELVFQKRKLPVYPEPPAAQLPSISA